MALILNYVIILQPVAKYGSFTVDSRPGEQWIRLKRKIGDEDIKVEVTMFDGSVPTAKSGGGAGDEVQLHITLIVNIAKCKDVDVLEIMCSAWPDSIEINRLFIRCGDKMPAQPYVGPEFKYVEFFLVCFLSVFHIDIKEPKSVWNFELLEPVEKNVLLIE